MAAYTKVPLYIIKDGLVYYSAFPSAPSFLFYAKKESRCSIPSYNSIYEFAEKAGGQGETKPGPHFSIV